MISLPSLAIFALVSVSFLVNTSIAHSTKRNPLSYVSLIEQPVIKTPSHRINSHSSFELIFTLHDGQQPIRLVLEPNHDLLHDDLILTFIGSDGVGDALPVTRNDHKVFKGKAFVHRDNHWAWEHAGWARINVRQDGAKPVFEGAFRIDGDNHHVQTGSTYLKVKHGNDPAIDLDKDGDELMVVYRDSDIMPDYALTSELKRGLSGPSCGSDSLIFNTNYDSEVRRSLQNDNLASMSARSLFGRQVVVDGGGQDVGANYVPDIGSIAGCPTTRKVALVGIATDCTYWEEFDHKREDIAQSVINMVNQASQLYEDTFSISLGIRNLSITDKPCNNAASDLTPWNLPCSSSASLNDRLNLFSGWRGRWDDPNAYWTLLTNCQNDSAVGLAWRGQLCRVGSAAAQDSQGQNETIAATNVVVRTGEEWQIFAHETGHTFGAVHDCTKAECPVDSQAQPCCPLSSSSCDAKGKFIMNPSTNAGISTFSPCSIGNICSGLMRNINSKCLTDNKNVGTFTGSQCGNGIVESGEECDCGGAEECDKNSCCDAKTCKFKEGAVCDPTNEDCCDDKCQFRASGTVCRESTSECDPEEKCAGDSGSCPSDDWKKDGDSCSNGLKCASGQCTSPDMQCRAMLGNPGDANDSFQSCGEDSCLLTCSSPSFKNGMCFQYNYNLIDGTSCGGGGLCDNGSCKGGSSFNRVVDWFKQNQNIAIPIIVVLGILVLASILSCIWTRLRRKSRLNNQRPKQPQMGSGGSNSTVGAFVQSRSNQNLLGRQGRRDRRRDQDRGQYTAPPPNYYGVNQAQPNQPEHAYQPPGNGRDFRPQEQQQQWYNNQSMRYA